MAAISITYTPNYSGCHRIYIRLVGAPNYCLFTDDSASTIDEPKTVVISSSENPEFFDCIGTPEEITCISTTPVEGYIQPCCAAENDMSLAAPFTFNVSSEYCAPFTASCKGSGIHRIVITNPGLGYTSDPTITILNGGSGSGFVANANIVLPSGIINTVTTVNFGDNYSNTAIVLFSDPPPGGIRAEGFVEFCPCGPACGQDSKVDTIECTGGLVRLYPPNPSRDLQLCSTETPVASNAPQVTISTGGPQGSTCCLCIEYLIQNNNKSETILVTYVECGEDLGNIVSTTITALSSSTICAVVNTINIPFYYGEVNITPIDACN